MEFFSQHWLAVLLVATLGAAIARSVLRSRARHRQLEEWAQQRRIQREREEVEEAERRRLAQAAQAERLCKTQEQLTQAIANGLEEITIEGQLSKAYGGSEAVERLGGGYKVVLARHGKVVLRRA